MGATTTLYRAVGPAELEGIRAAGNRGFPRRPHHEPVLALYGSEAQARRVAGAWSRDDARPGYVIRFEVDAGWHEALRASRAGEAGEWWLAAEELPGLNASLRGEIRVVAALRPSGGRPPGR